MSNEYGAIPLSTANAVGASLKKKMGSLTGFAPVDWAETINKLGNKLPERTVSGAVCSFTDGADDVPMTEVKASITAVQAGGGDPSPSNVRAISGFAECDVVHTGANLFDKDTGTLGVWVSAQGVESSNLLGYMSEFIEIHSNLVLKCFSTTSLYLFGFAEYDKNGVFIARTTVTASSSVNSVSLTPNQNTSKIKVLLSTPQGTANTQEYIDSFKAVLSPTTPTTYESYAGETIPVWMGGINLWGGGVMLDSFKNAGISGLTYDDSTVVYSGVNVTGKVIPTIKYKENTQYTFILSMSNSLAYDATNLYVYYTDNTRQQMKLPSASAGTKQTVVFTTASGKTVDRVQGVNAAGTSTLYYNESGLFEGVKTAQDFEPVRYIYGGELNLTTGVLTVTHEMQTYDGDENWQTNGSNGVYLTIDSSTTLYSNVALCNIYTCMTAGGSGGLTNNSCRLNQNKNNIMVKNPDALTAEYFVTALQSQPMVVLLELATPTTIQLTAEEVRSFLGTNNIWANTGDSECTYFAQPSGGITPVFTETVICDNSSASSTLTFTEDWHDYDLLQFKLTNSSSGIITYITTTPDILDEIFTRSSSKVLFNEFSNDQYALYTKSSDLSWSRTGTRNVNVTEVKGLTATNCTVTTEWIYKRQAISASNVTITASKYFEAYDEIYMASCDGDSDDTMPCILPVRAGCAGYNFYGNNGRNCVRLTGNTASDTYGKDETKNIFAMMGINYEEV